MKLFNNQILGKIHFYIGITIVIIFLLTGQYMHHDFNHLKDMEPMNRALFRAGHLYILLFGLVNISLGAYFKPLENRLYTKIQLLASIIVFIASFLVILGFFYELPTMEIERPITRYSLYAILLGVSMHGLISLMKNKQ